MKVFLAFCLVFFLLACSEEKKPKIETQTKEEILLEESDEKIDINDSNLPLPIDDTQGFINLKLSSQNV